MDSLLDGEARCDDAFWARFEGAFGADVAALSREDHWYYDKEDSDIG